MSFSREPKTEPWGTPLFVSEDKRFNSNFENMTYDLWRFVFTVHALCRLLASHCVIVLRRLEKQQQPSSSPCIPPSPRMARNVWSSDADQDLL